VPNAETAPDPQQRWRLVEPARLARVSAQQVRNYLDMGVLPPVERTANGYRAFTTHHADALITTRALAAGHGWRRGHHHEFDPPRGHRRRARGDR
jgi:hypothetical protein